MKRRKRETCEKIKWNTGRQDTSQSDHMVSMWRTGKEINCYLKLKYILLIFIFFDSYLSLHKHENSILKYLSGFLDPVITSLGLYATKACLVGGAGKVQCIAS